MARVIDVIRRFFPNGTNPIPLGDGGATADDRIRIFPFWPPDLFAIAATLVERTECYADDHFNGTAVHSLFGSAAFVKEVSEIGERWRSISSVDAMGDVGKALQELWQQILACAEENVERREEPSEKTLSWWLAAIKLLAIADEASRGMGFLGFLPRSQVGSSTRIDVRDAPRLLANQVLAEYEHAVKDPNHAGKTLPRPLQTLCCMVPSNEVCVQPKTTTAQVGCSLRSLTHNLALLPPIGQVTTHWVLVPRSAESAEETPPWQRALNLLLVPFPYEVDGRSFVPCVVRADSPEAPDQRRFFRVEQSWLKRAGAVPDVAGFIRSLVTASHREVEQVHGVVLPELALNRLLAEGVAKRLAEDTNLEFFIAGVTSENGFEPINAVYGCVFVNNRVEAPWVQAKHHRWKLDSSQIRRYHIGDRLTPVGEWWEQITVKNRSAYFYVFRPGASLTALVCEDLARIDPVQPVLRSIGPNLVIALLMDGPQLPFRWPNRYATVLADDPGSAVLTLTSLGMVRRSVDPGQPEPSTIGLWRDASASETIELKLPSAAHALLVTITLSRHKDYTLDGRHDAEGTLKLKLMGVRAIHGPSVGQDFVR